MRHGRQQVADDSVGRPPAGTLHRLDRARLVEQENLVLAQENCTEFGDKELAEMRYFSRTARICLRR